MTIQSKELLKQANIIRAHSIPIVPKHDHSNTMNYAWDQSFFISGGHWPKMKISSLLLDTLTFSKCRVKLKRNKPRNHQLLVVLSEVSQAFNQVQARTGYKMNKTVLSQQVISQMIFFVIRSKSRSREPDLLWPTLSWPTSFIMSHPPPPPSPETDFSACWVRLQLPWELKLGPWKEVCLEHCIFMSSNRRGRALL
jgi:hypothetical protein